MNVAIIGSGGREHALALSISKSNLLDRLFCLPGNPGTKKIATNIQIGINDFEKILQFCKENRIDLVVIGPEQPLVDGLSDYLRANNIIVFGPSSAASKIESSKSFAKTIMQKAGVPTATYNEFSATELNSAISYLEKSNFPIVIKADGLAAGKGVFICENINEATNIVKAISLDGIFGSAGQKFLIEEFMIGEEASIFAITDGENFITLPAAQDYKRVGDNDTGKNTGGMGAYAPAPLISKELEELVQHKIFQPMIRQLKEVGYPFIGCLYAGLMITKDGPKVVEFNCRFGDPETQVVLPLLEGDVLKLLFSAATGKLDMESVRYSSGCSVCVVAASEGYPDKFEKGFEITGLDIDDPQIIIYHAGTTEKEGKILTNGGRVLGITSVLKNNNLLEARNKAYEAIKKINFKNIYYRKDIASKALRYL
ncbi:Phosphoribosylamine-glycine ligase [Ignavibacterium album JCM 16511]|uniref:Phosphoribosylamine--glycine ligase n=1 Tax=Ignavibacterium album (strain DSM 19864 / JCM 16511 / NBRC 101810 / Mat9-16) TaxID=945713 RepID=I0AKH6_IGNAJ|nr:phosphoribosylamine--glycine ligase [Ignavibacterium album]AFH49483.1 Phosphoribosylamine-glycine ligase [Ignavibacterium album JCM 16511]